ncbi:MAG TPA: AI-2E family transporter [Alphaproteobacteria bacterium]|nr:AI-2E family transporter [Alphaproteobacteria bacterium]
MSISQSAGTPLKPFAKPSAPDVAKLLTIFVMAVAILYFGKEVLLPITLALLLAFLLSPIVSVLMRWKLGRVPSVLIAVALALSVILAVGSVIGTQLSGLTEDLPHYTPTIKAKIETIQGRTVGRLSRWVDQLGSRDAKQNPLTQAQTARPGARQQQPQPQPAAQPSSVIGDYLTRILSPLATFPIIFVVAIFALLQREDLRNRLVWLIGTNDLHHTVVALDDATRRLSRYYLTLTTVNAVFAVVIGLGLLAIGVPNPVLWGLIAGLLRFVPYVGPIIAAIFPIALAAAVDPGWTTVIWTAALFLTVEPITGQFIEPMIYGSNTGLSPFSVVVAAIFWSWLWGPAGLLLSTPLTLCLVVIGRHAGRLEYLDVLLGDRPALTPVEVFYQRLLADDPEEALGDAETLLKTMSLAAYYDEIAIAGLRRASHDQRRSAIGKPQIACIERAVDVLISGIETYLEGPLPKDKTPPILPTDADRRPVVLCVAGRSPLDEAATVMLVQLLVQNGLSTRMVLCSAVSDEEVAALDVEDVVATCICHVDAAMHPASLRRLIRRLRSHLPEHTPIVAGLWAPDAPALKDSALQAEIGADCFADGLKQLVAFCRSEGEPPLRNRTKANTA